MFLRKNKNFNISHTLKLNKLRDRAVSKISEMYLGDGTRVLKRSRRTASTIDHE